MMSPGCGPQSSIAADALRIWVPNRSCGALVKITGHWNYGTQGSGVRIPPAAPSMKTYWGLMMRIPKWLIDILTAGRKVLTRVLMGVDS